MFLPGTVCIAVISSFMCVRLYVDQFCLSHHYIIHYSIVTATNNIVFFPLARGVQQATQFNRLWATGDCELAYIDSQLLARMDGSSGIRSRSEWLVFSGKDDDFPVWLDRFEAYMRMKKLYPVLSGDIVAPVAPEVYAGTDGTLTTKYASDVQAYETLRDKFEDNKVVIWCELVQFIDRESLSMLRHDCKNDGPKAWKELKDRFKSAAKPRVMTLMGQLTSLKLGPTESIESYLNRAREVSYNLHEVNEPVSDSMLTSLVLRGLPEQYNSFVTMQSFSTADFAEMRRKLQTHADSMVLKEAESSTAQSYALYGNFRGGGASHYSGGRGFNNRGRGAPRGNARGGSRGRGQSNGPGNGEFRGKCHKCHEIGHKRTECPQNVHTPLAVHAATSNLCLHTNSTSSQYFIIDSGCTDHMLKDDKYFIEYTKVSSGTTRNADNSESVIVGKGRAAVSVINDRGEKLSLVLEDALHVPDYGYNLISVTSATDKGHHVLFEQQNGSFHMTNGEVIPLVKDKHLYLLECSAEPKPECHSSIKGQAKTQLDASLWHRRLGHLNMQDVRNTLGESLTSDPSQCETCPLAKTTKASVPSSVGSYGRATEPLYRVFSDVCGPMRTESLGGSRYVVSFIDDYSRFSVLYFIKLKSEVLNCFKRFRAEYGQGGIVRILRSDNGGEYTSRAFAQFCTDEGIKQEFTVPDTPQQNGVAERYFRTIVEMTRCLLLDSGLPKLLWVRAMDTACYTRNRCCNSSLRRGTTPFELFYDRPVDYSKFRVFGCTAFSLSRDRTRGKLDPKADKGVFVGYDSCSPAYLVYFVGNQQVQRARNVIFDETAVCQSTDVKESAGDLEADIFELLVSADPDIVVEPENVTTEPEEVEQAPENTTDSPLQRPRRTIRAPARFGDYVMYGDNDDDEPFCAFSLGDGSPRSLTEALRTTEAEKWKEAAQAEYDALTRNETWTLESLPKGRKSVGGKWVFKVKRNADGSIDKYKARYVAKGFTQIEGLDYHETFAPTSKPETIRLILSLAAQEGATLWLMDVKSAFLQASVDEEIYVDQPPGFEELHSDGSKLYCRLKKSLYGLKQAGHNWNAELDKWLIDQGFTKSKVDICLYSWKSGDSFIYIVIWVDDVIICGSSIDVVNDMRKRFTNSFEMDDRGSLSWFLGMSITQEPGVVTLDQSAYTKILLERFGMMDSKATQTPLAVKEELTKEQCPEDGSQEQIRMRQFDYRGVVGGLLFLATHTRPDISYAVGTLSKFLANPGFIHWTAAKRVLRYLRGTVDYRLSFRKSEKIALFGYCDADWSSDRDDRKSVSGYCFFVNSESAAISWSSRKQQTVSLSSAEAEYMAISSAGQEVIFLANLLEEIFGWTGRTVIYEDNQACISMTQNPQFHQRTKHIDIRHHYIRDLVKNGFIELIYCPTASMVADVLTKGLDRLKTELFTKVLLNFNICVGENTHIFTR